ncbi:hypothetical protein BDZ89DRAFT_1072850 [Hymenopellis radicata]|nr:hypothetical protein BDZ89DRAFT_1072850 [Hymenopellis radicata]
MTTSQTEDLLSFVQGEWRGNGTAYFMNRQHCKAEFRLCATSNDALHVDCRRTSTWAEGDLDKPTALATALDPPDIFFAIDITFEGPDAASENAIAATVKNLNNEQSTKLFAERTSHDLFRGGSRSCTIIYRDEDISQRQYFLRLHFGDPEDGPNGLLRLAVTIRTTLIQGLAEELRTDMGIAGAILLPQVTEDELIPISRGPTFSWSIALHCGKWFGKGQAIHHSGEHEKNISVWVLYDLRRCQEDESTFLPEACPHRLKVSVRAFDEAETGDTSTERKKKKRKIDLQETWDKASLCSLIAECDATIVRRDGQGWFVPREQGTGSELESRGFVFNICSDSLFTDIPVSDREPVPPELVVPLGTPISYEARGETVYTVVTGPPDGAPFPGVGKEAAYIPSVLTMHRGVHTISVVARHVEEGYVVCRDIDVRGLRRWGEYWDL